MNRPICGDRQAPLRLAWGIHERNGMECRLSLIVPRGTPGIGA